MNFRIQEIIKMLVPGSVLLTCLYILFFPISTLEKGLNKDYIAIYLLIMVSLTYVIGYYVDWIGSLIERIYYKYGTKPSEHLLNNLSGEKSFGITMSKYKEIGELLCRCIGEPTTEKFDKNLSERLFKVANVIREQNCNDILNERLKDFYFYTIFSRNLASSFLLTLILYPLLYLCNIVDLGDSVRQASSWSNFNFFFLFSLPILTFTFFRWKEHAKYYSRQIFYVACTELFKVESKRI